jgi:predicted NBD/HSP70 family sugar kinase
MYIPQSRFASTHDIRRDNRSLVLNLLRWHTQMSRMELARKARLTEPAISRITRELVDAGLIEEKEESTDGRPGRPTMSLSLKGDGLYVLGMDIGANSQSLCLADLSGNIIAREDLNLLSFDSTETALSYGAEKARHMVEASGIERRRLAGIGVGIAGAVDSSNRVLLKAPTLGWDNLPVADIVETALSIPTWVEGRPRAILQAEQTTGIARQKNNVLLVHLGLGIGIALMIDRHLLRGAKNAAGQIAHLKVESAGIQCVCGEYGCLDTVASGYAVLAQLGMAMTPAQSRTARVGNTWLLKHAVEMAHAKDTAANAIFRSAGESLGRALNRFASVFDPELIVLAGTIAQIPDYVEGAREHFHLPDVSLAVSVMSLEQAAACLALNAYVFAPQLDLKRLVEDRA